LNLAYVTTKTEMKLFDYAYITASLFSFFTDNVVWNWYSFGYAAATEACNNFDPHAFCMGVPFFFLPFPVPFPFPYVLFTSRQTFKQTSDKLQTNFRQT
jgi:hypothetical protein